jgi:alanyl-tRNA synthetase
MDSQFTGNQVRKTFIEFFKEKGHTYVPSSSLVPGGDATLLFTNAGMVQFKDIFLGTDKPNYTRAVNSQKCMRVAGKHNDLDDVGRDDWHHTFFEMLGNWSFGDYYKKDAITWAWELLTEVWKIEKSNLWVTVFKDEKGEIPTDEEAATIWKQQPGIIHSQILYFGRKENFWEMAETGPCGPCSEIHIDRGPDFCNRQNEDGHICRVNGDCTRFLELWNNVFIQYNRVNENQLDQLPSTHVDTGMGFERIVSVLQNVNSNYKTDLLVPLINTVQDLTGADEESVMKNYTPYRVIADHARAATFLISDGVVPGNTGRNYVCRMIIRRASRFGGKIGLNEPFLAKVAETIISNYGEAYPDLKRNKATILDNLTREEIRFHKTLEAGLSHLENLFEMLKSEKHKIISGQDAFDLYATHGLPFEITRDIAREMGFDVDERGFIASMEEHRLDSGAGKVFGLMGADDVDIFRIEFEKLKENGLIDQNGVIYDPYEKLEIQAPVISLFKDGQTVEFAQAEDIVEIILPETCFYVESGGQVTDTGEITSEENKGLKIVIEHVRRPAAGMIVHHGRIVNGKLKKGDMVTASVDVDRRMNIMRNHTATHLLHSQLQKVLGDHARQAGSLVAPDRLRFDFTHPEPLSHEQLDEIEKGVNFAIMADYSLNIKKQKLSDAISDGAMALFGEKYGEEVRTITIGDEIPISYELCGGTHVHDTSQIGAFVIISEGSTAAGIRRIEAITGIDAYEVVHKRSNIVKQLSGLLSSNVDNLVEKIDGLIKENEYEKKENIRLRQSIALDSFRNDLDHVLQIGDINVLATIIVNADIEILRSMTDLFKEKYESGVVVLGSVVNEKPIIIAAVTDNLIHKGLHAGQIVKHVASMVGGGGGGRPTLAQAGGKDAKKLPEAIQSVTAYVKSNLK